MRKKETQPLKGVIREYLESLGHSRKIKEISVIASWEKLMGKMVARHTKKIFIRNKTLYVYLDSSVMRSELIMMKEEIRTQLNNQAGVEVVQKVMFM